MKSLTSLAVAIVLPALHGATAPHIEPPPDIPADQVQAPAVKSADDGSIITAPDPDRFVHYFRPFQTETATISPDGNYFAYSLRQEDKLYVIVCPVADPSKPTARVLVGTDETSTGMLVQNQGEKTPARINWLGWTSPTRVVVDTNRVLARTVGPEANWVNWRGCIMTFNADGSDARIVAKPDDFPDSYISTPELQRFASPHDDHSFAARNPAIDEPPPSLDATGDFGAPDLGDDDQDSAEPELPVADVVSLPVNIRATGLDPARPGSILLTISGSRRTDGTRATGQFSLDIATGKSTEVNVDAAPSNRAVLLDRQGRIRIDLPNTTLASLPFRYDYLGPKGTSRPSPLQNASGTPPLPFVESPDTFFGERSVPVGFDEDPDILYYASNVGRDTFGLYSLRLSDGHRGALTLENPAFDLIDVPLDGFADPDLLVFDPYDHKLAGIRYHGAERTAVWLRPELREAQAVMLSTFHGRAISLVDWDASRTKFIVTSQSPADAGGFYLYDKTTNKLLELARRTPWIDATHAHATLPFTFKLDDGGRITGLITVPGHPRLKPAPLVIVCPDVPWHRVVSDFRSDVQALADMGFAVAQLNPRGAWGLGRQHREALLRGYADLQATDIAQAVEKLDQAFRIDRKRVALIGGGYGGHVALRAMQLYPDKFRCAVTLDAPVDLGAWLTDRYWSRDDITAQLTRTMFGDKAYLAKRELIAHPGEIKRPVLMLNYAGPDGGWRSKDYLIAKNFAADLRHQTPGCEFDDLTTDFEQGLPNARSKVFARIEAFFNTNIYSFGVRVDPVEVVP